MRGRPRVSPLWAMQVGDEIVVPCAPEARHDTQRRLGQVVRCIRRHQPTTQWATWRCTDGIGVERVA